MPEVVGLTASGVTNSEAKNGEVGSRDVASQPKPKFRTYWRPRNRGRPAGNSKEQSISESGTCNEGNASELLEPVRKVNDERRKASGTSVEGGTAAIDGSSRREFRRFRRPNVPPRPQRNPVQTLKVLNEQNADGHPETTSEDKTEANEETAAVEAVKEKPPKRRICKYFAAEQVCYFGDRCRFRHVIEAKPKEEVLKTEADIGSSTPAVRKPVVALSAPRFNILSSEAAGSDKQREARDSEIAYFKRRFPRCTVSLDDAGTYLEFTYTVTDPDWKFDVKWLMLSICIPPLYPVEVGTVRVVGPELPPLLTSHIERKINEFLMSKFSMAKEKNSYECVGKWLLRWIDRTILEMFVEGLRKTRLVVQAEKAGISLVMPQASGTLDSTPSAVAASSTVTGDEEVKENADNGDENDVEGVEELSGNEHSEGRLSDVESPEKAENVEAVSEAPEAAEPPASLEVRVQWKDSSGNIASLAVAALALSLKCARCEALFFLTCLPRRSVTSRCIKCGNGQSVKMQPELVHANSNVIARIEPKGCRPVDCVLLSSSFRLVCLACNKEAVAENLIYGSLHKKWCFSCHTRCEFEISAIRFAGNFQNIAKEDSSVARVKGPRKKKPEQSIVIVEGGPLPENGTCKHYKKSYRWFRFPCCGKVYPCDSCHDAAEPDHEMKLANRMICGFCSKEQPFQKAKPCINCNENVTRSKSAYWEGGKGCRDQAVMSRNDNRKHTNSRKKTVSKKGTGLLAIKKTSEKNADS